MEKKPYSEDINDLIEAEEIEKGRGPDRQKRQSRGSGHSEEERALNRQRNLTESNLKFVAHKKQGDAIKEGKQKAGARRIETESAKHTTAARVAEFKKSEDEIEKAKGKKEKVMGEFHEGTLHSGSKKGPKVTDPKQAVAIAYSEEREAKKSDSYQSPKPIYKAEKPYQDDINDMIEKGGAGSGQKGHTTYQPAKIPGYKYTHAEIRGHNETHHYESEHRASEIRDEDKHHQQLSEHVKAHHGKYIKHSNGMSSNKVAGTGLGVRGGKDPDKKHLFEVTLNKPT